MVFVVRLVVTPIKFEILKTCSADTKVRQSSLFCHPSTIFHSTKDLVITWPFGMGIGTARYGLHAVRNPYLGDL